MKVEPKQLDALLHPQFDAAALKAATAGCPGPARLPWRRLRQGVFHSCRGGGSGQQR